MGDGRASIRGRFTELVSADDDQHLDLAEAALLIAAYERPDEVDVPLGLVALDTFAATVRPPTLDGLCRLVYGGLGFNGNTTDYYDPRNSHLDLVISRRTGLPITLAVILIEIGRRCGVPLFGVGMPGHFLVGDRVDRDVFIDPFRRGVQLTRDECAAMFTAMQGPEAEFRPEYLAETPPHQIILRILNNLRLSHHQRREHASEARALELMLSVPGCPSGERRNLAAALDRVGHFPEAAEQLELLAEEAERAGGADAHRTAEELRRAAGRIVARLN